jgi:hypothetical protein
MNRIKPLTGRQMQDACRSPEPLTLNPALNLNLPCPFSAGANQSWVEIKIKSKITIKSPLSSLPHLRSSPNLRGTRP